jgi:uncharacterized protein (DUF608 family)
MTSGLPQLPVPCKQRNGEREIGAKRLLPFSIFACLLMTAGRAPEPARGQQPAPIENRKSPIENAYDSQTGTVHSQRWASGVPLGGIGCGTFQLLTDGTVSRATINNNWTQPTGDLKGCFAAVWTSAGGRTQSMALKLKSEFGLPAVSAIDYRGIFPQALLDFPDARLPVSLSLRAYSPLVPHDVKSSALPVAIFVFTITNESRAPVEASIALSWENFLGVGGSAGKGAFAERVGNTVEHIPAKEGIFGMRLASSTRQGVDPPDRSRYNARGNYALLAQPPTQDTAVTQGGWNALDAAPGWWGQFAKDGTVSGTVGPAVDGSVHPAAVISMRVALKERETRELAFAVAWYTPRLYTDSGAEYGHIYEKTFEDANAVGRYALENRLSLRALTEEWQNRLLRSSLPGWLSRKIVNDAAPLFTHTILTRDSGLGGTKPGPPLFAVIGTVGGGDGALGVMDRRLISHGLFSTFFPSLDVQELRQFAAAQATTGAITRLDGALDEVIGGPIGPDLKEAHTDAPGRRLQLRVPNRQALPLDRRPAVHGPVLSHRQARHRVRRHAGHRRRRHP